ncbi:MAG: YhfZ family protein, partial [Eubacterium sp.]
MNPNFYKKTGLAIINIARDFYTMQEGDRVPTIAEYTQRFSVSRGIVQKAIAALEADHCIETQKNGVKGTFAVKLDYQKLYSYTNWGSLTGTMPVPLTESLSSLTTAICEEMEQSPFPFSFAYVTGSQKRLEALEKMIYDFIVVSKSSAEKYLKEYDFLEEAIELKNCIYSAPYILYFFDESKTEVEDGMRMAVDINSTDQYEISKKLCENKNVEFVQTPYSTFSKLLTNKSVDCFIYREDGWYNNLKPDLKQIQIDLPNYSREEMVTPVILIHKENYGFKKLISH